MARFETPRRHRRDDVAQTALRILDDHGLPELTMRRLAAALDVQPSALYWHFENKQTLIADLADRIVATADARPAAQPDHSKEGSRPGPDVWRDVVRGEAHALRDALLAYRDGAEVVSSTYALGLGSGRALERLRASVALGGFDEPTAERAATALLHFILGHVSHEQQRMQYDAFGVVAPSAALEPRGAKSSRRSGEQATGFAFGVDLLVSGLGSLASSSFRETSEPAAR
ncbi:TetR/AcrR family transcriptional regulator C-terminal domain-containing protein [Herbiconiux sp. A18JL235]|uniref:TetR/AcrR family transcriptional regulator C-terminal domain-containing protein n=1 Tax=Herbiconiux sp. A18JL235 TaxID=3152363 RepID=A0AB39BH33_9MICO